MIGNRANAIIMPPIPKIAKQMPVEKILHARFKRAIISAAAKCTVSQGCSIRLGGRFE